MSKTVEKFGKYLLLEKIAAGGMAEIYLARSGAANGLNKFFAIKRILPQFSNNRDFVEMFKEEAKVAINLNHNNVVSIYDFGIEAGQFYLVMDFVEGRNLRQIINELKKTNKTLSIEQILYVIKEVASGLDHAHRCTDANSGRPLNITHRDMSPQNVMISFEGEVKVIDFGIAKAETEAEDTKAGTLKGKFSYMSPEQAEGQNIDPRTDIFALGIVLWELLANDRLFTGSNETAILRKVRDCQVPSIRKINPTVPPELERIVMKALAKDRNVRYQTAANLHRDLNRFLNTQYPDFSQQDFSQSLKDYFKTSYQEGRDKLIAYSNLESPSTAEANTSVTSHTKHKNADAPTITENNNKKNIDAKAPPIPVDLPQIPTGMAAPSEKQVKVNLDGLKLNNPLPPVSPANSNQKNKSQNNVGNQTKVTQITQTGHSQKLHYNQKSSDFSQIFFKLAMLCGLVFAGWWGYKNHFSNLITSEPSPIRKPVSNSQQNSGQINQSSIAEVKISLDSSPSQAEIIIDGKNTGQKTPALISIAANKNIEIYFKKEGYLDYKVSRSFAQTSTFAATLQPTVTSAYLNITTSDKDAFTKVSINGQELLEKPPILKFPIVAEKETIIKAYNPITKSTDQVTIKAKSGETIDVKLILKSLK